MPDNDVQVQFGAKIDELLNAFQQLSSSAQEQFDKVNSSLSQLNDNSKQTAQAITDSTKQIQSAFTTMQSSLASAFASIRSGVAALAGILASGALFKSSVDAVVNWEGEISKLSRTLGVTTEKASELAMGLKLVGMGSDQYLQLVQKLERQVKTHSDTLEKLGIVLKDPVTGNTRDLMDVMANAAEVIAKYKEGGDQAQVTMAIFGGRVGDIGPLLRMNNDLMAIARQTLAELGMTVSKDNVQALRQYQIELNKFKAGWQSIEMQIGQAIMPLLKDLAKWMNTEGPGAIQTCIGVLQSLVEGLAEVAAGVQKVLVYWEALPKAANAAFETFNKGIAEAADTFIPGSGMFLFGSDAYSKAQTGFEGLKDSVVKDLAAIDAKLGETKAKIAATFAKSAETGAGSAGGAGPAGLQAPDWLTEGAGGAAASAKDIVAQYEQELQRIKDSQTDLNAWSAQKDFEFWNEKLQTANSGSDEWWAIMHKMADDLRTMTAEQKAELDKQAAQETATLRNIAAMQKTDAESAMKMAKEKYDTLYALGGISASQRAQLEKEADQKAYDESLTAYYKELASLTQTGQELIAKQSAIYAQMEKLKQDYLQKMQKAEDQAATAMKKTWDQYATEVGNAITGLLFKHQTFLQAVQNLTERMVGKLIDLGLKDVENWILVQLKKTSATEVGVATRTAAETAGASAGIIADAAAAIKSIVTSAAETFAGIFGFLAPVMGPAAAGPAAAGMGTVLAVEGMVATAAGGFDVPANTLALLHQREMVLPASLADKVRDMAEGGSGGDHLHLHINATDSRSFEEQLENSSSKLNQLLSRAFRDFHLRRR